MLEEVLVDGVPAELMPPEQLRAEPNEKSTTNAASFATTQQGQRELRIRPGRHALEIRYTGLSFTAPERLRFRYRLKGLKDDWVEAGAARSATYPYIPPGQYQFEVVAFNAEGVANRQPAELLLSVSPRFWQTRWFIASSALLALLLVAGIARMIEQRKLKRHLLQIEHERAIEQERSRIARDLHDDLGSSLTRISLLGDLTRADKDNPAQVAAHAEKISQSAAQTVRALEEIVWAVRPGSDSLPSLVDYIVHFATEVFSGTDIHCRLDVPAELPPHPLAPDVRHNIFLIVKEALTNALKHSGAKEVILAARLESGSVEFTVSDDGKGLIEPDGSKNHRNGFNNMRQRAASIGATLAFESEMKKGTRVRLRVPLVPLKTMAGL
jgi:signal transduction histidine kinase